MNIECKHLELTSKSLRQAVICKVSNVNCEYSIKSNLL